MYSRNQVQKDFENTRVQEYKNTFKKKGRYDERKVEKIC